MLWFEMVNPSSNMCQEFSQTLIRFFSLSFLSPLPSKCSRRRISGDISVSARTPLADLRRYVTLIIFISTIFKYLSQFPSRYDFDCALCDWSPIRMVSGDYPGRCQSVTTLSESSIVSSQETESECINSFCPLSLPGPSKTDCVRLTSATQCC